MNSFGPGWRHPDGGEKPRPLLLGRNEGGAEITQGIYKRSSFREGKSTAIKTLAGWSNTQVAHTNDRVNQYADQLTLRDDSPS